MKKTVSLILALILICTTLFSLTSCFGSSTDVDGLNAKISELTEQINTASTKITTLEAQNAALTEEKADLILEVNSLESEMATLTETRTAFEAENAQLEAEITELNAEVARLQTLMEGNSNELLEEIAELEAKVESLEAEVSTLKSDKANLESQITSLNAQISTLNAEKATLTSKVAELEASIEAKNTEIANLNSTVSALTTEKNTLIAEKNALVTENSELKEENKELTDLVEAFRNCFKDIHTYADGFCTICGKEIGFKYTYIRTGEYIYFGEYPQTIKADDVIITDTVDSRGYYLGSDGCYYAKVVASPYESDYKFSTGKFVHSGETYYFKSEPIRWKVLSEENGEAFLLCNIIIDSHIYDDNSNNYCESEIRKWLNNTFYKTAFADLQRSIILNTEVDNGENEKSIDKIFLLSEKEATSSIYGFSSRGYRLHYTTDYGKAVGLYISPKNSSSYWMLRSFSDGSIYVRGIDTDGYVVTFSINNTKYGILPALRIKL